MQWSDLPLWAYAASAGAVVLALLAVWLLVRRRRPVSVPLVLQPNLNDAPTVDRAVARILEQMAAWVPGQAYHAYWLSADGTILQLRASITDTANPAVVPDYSGLITEDTPLVPLGLPCSEKREQPEIVGGRAERWLEVPVGRHLAVRILLKHRQSIPAPLLQRLKEAGDMYAPLTLAIYEWFKARDNSERTRSLMDSTRVALDTTLRMDRALELLLRVGGNLIESRVNCAVVASAGNPLSLSDTPQGRGLGERILQGQVPALLSLPTGPDVVPGGNLGPMGISYNACVRVPLFLEGEPLGCFFYFVQQAIRLNSYQTAVLKALGDRGAHLVMSQRQVQSASASYMETLHVLVNAMDGLSPHSLGHSDRLARYARLVAIELGLDDREVEAVAMAAYFHDVGMVAVDPRVVLKPDRLTADEYEQVKSHAELGAQMVGPLQDPLPLAALVASHHERWDGHGYPQGLKGEDIPVGARIISAVDLFDAKTTGRSYRSPLPFARALHDVSRAGGSHLDPRVAEAFVAAMERPRRQAGSGLPLAPCWEIKQLPAHVCAGCPNRLEQVARCWDNRDHLCTRHGDQCETCIVYTETVSRGVSSAPNVSSH